MYGLANTEPNANIRNESKTTKFILSGCRVDYQQYSLQIERRATNTIAKKTHKEP